MKCVKSQQHHVYVRWRRYRCPQCGLNLSTLELTVNDLLKVREALENIVGDLHVQER